LIVISKNMNLWLLPVCVVSGLLAACNSEKDWQSVVLVGAHSVPAFEDVNVGDHIGLEDRKHLAVFGAGDLGLTPWGSLAIQDGQERNPTFNSGGVIGWLKSGPDVSRIKGEATVPLVAYLLKVKADKDRTFKESKVEAKWKIPRGNFDLALEPQKD
jgi:hypothetical protein